MKAHMNLKNVAAAAHIMRELWDREVTPENFADWRRENGMRIFDAMIGFEVALDTFIEVEAYDPEGLATLATNA